MTMTPHHETPHAGVEASASVTPVIAKLKRFRVGVLFVHGIGEQPQGDTLIRFAEPVIEWITRWVEQPANHEEKGGPMRGSARLARVALGPPMLGERRPPHAILEVNAGNPAAGPGQSSCWLLAESWWASEFRKPRFGELAGWLLTTGCWMILSHAGKTVRLSSRNWPRRLRAIGMLLVSLPAALLVQIVVATLAILAAIPIPQLRSALSGVLLKLTGTLGDSYVLISSPLQKAAAVSNAQKDLKWLSRQCDTVVVVAHSQGAAIAHAALQSPEPKNVYRFITIGSGLGKLEELQVLGERGRLFFILSQIAVPLFAVVAIFYPRLWSAYRTENDLTAFALLLYPAVLLGAVIVLALKGSATYLKRVEELSLKTCRPDLEWSDYYATSDPVPNGPLGAHGKPFEGMTQHEVVNFMSLLRDHSTYFQNRDQFVSRAVRDIDSTADTGLFWPGDEDRIKAAERARRPRVRMLWMTRLLTLLAMAIGLFALRHELNAIGRGFYDVLKGMPVLEAVAYFLRAVGLASQKIVSQLTGISAEWVRKGGFIALGVTIPVGALLLWQRVTLKLWKWWDNLSTRHLFRPGAFPVHPADRAFVVLTVVAAGLVPIVMAGLALVWPNPRELAANLFSLAHTSGKVVVGGLLVLGIVVGVVSNFTSAISWLKRRLKHGRKEESGAASE